jgi:16S rRNA (uracil1498-N3)-methyltransferase
MDDNPTVMLPRFYAPGLEPSQRDATLPADESHHLTRVMRLGDGDVVTVFDGRGREYRARVAHASRGAVRVDLLEPVSPAPEPRIALTLAQAILKGDKMDAVVRDATMMGVSAVVPIVASHGAVKVTALSARRAADRWRRVAVSSAKQCRRAVVPAIADPVSFDRWLAGGSAGLRLLLVEPAAARGRAMQSIADQPPAGAVTVIVGPEGGWSEDEVRGAIEAGCLPVTLGGTTLRADAAPLCALTVVRFALGDL